MQVATQTGFLTSGSRYLIETPSSWNGVLLLCARPVPVAVGEPPWEERGPMLERLLEQGYALAGSANTIFWPLERAFADQGDLLDSFDRLVRSPRRTIAWGHSIGGIISAGLVQLMPERLSGALPLCGNLAGAVATHNRELDIAFVVQTLLAVNAPLELVNITEPGPNLRVAAGLLEEVQGSGAGRARLALAAAVGNTPGWQVPGDPQPHPHDFTARQLSQYQLFRDVGFLVFFWARAQVEQQAGGNPSWNTGVDYQELLEQSIDRDVVEGLYEEVGLDLAGDLDVLAHAPRISADPAAIAYLERHVVFSGELDGLPVLTAHTAGDGLVPADHEHAYADVVRWAGNEHLLRQLYVERAGHCTFTPSEMLTALEALEERIETGAWPALDPAQLNQRAIDLDTHDNLGPSSRPAFFAFEPSPFPRPYDIRSLSPSSLPGMVDSRPHPV